MSEQIILIILGVIIALMTWALKLLISVDKKVGGFEAWRVAHDKQDDERHDGVKANIDRINERLNRRAS